MSVLLDRLEWAQKHANNTHVENGRIVDAADLREAISLLKACREALGGLFGELMNPDVVIARIPLSDEPLDRAAAVMKALDGADVHARIGRA